MKKIALLLCLISCLCLRAKADHITGGEMYYTLLSSTGNMYQYEVTLKLYMRCSSGRQFNNPTIVTAYDAVTGAHIQDFTVGLSSQENINLSSNSNPCVTDPPFVCYDVGYYHFVVTLPYSAHGYILASQVNYRIAGINNLSLGYGLIGATYTAEIPGSQPQATGPENNSAHFVGSDLVVVCAENPFTYSFAAQDADGDELRYSFCNSYISGSAGTVAVPPPPPYTSVPYGSGFSGNAPLGPSVQIDEHTGLITGRAPEAGVYVVTVCVQEIRDGTVIATQRKDLQIFIAPCTIAAAALLPEYQLCHTSTTINITNNSSSPLIHTYNWILLDAAGHVVTTSVNTSFNHTFTDTGIYHIKLYINKSEQCSDSTTSLIRVYPGFQGAFSFNGICINKPTNFFDASTSRYGVINSWRWDLGDPSSVTDIVTVRNPVYTYPDQGSKNVVLIVTDTKGCRDTVTKTVDILEKPPITFAFRDTLICLGDPLQLHAAGEGIFTWTPNIAIVNASSPTPTVTPSSTTTYIAHLNDQGCLNTDSVKVRVVDHVTLRMMADTIICQGDTIRLHLLSDGLRYAWTPAAQMIDAGVANPFCFTSATTIYHVAVTIGSCAASGQVTVATVPYPFARVGEDTVICFGTTAQLQGQSDGISFNWSPAGTLFNSNTLSPVAHPKASTLYVLSVFDNKGCPKPGKDTILVTVRPKIQAFAGHDTAVTINQPLHLDASGGVGYSWSPGTNLSATNVHDPIAVFTSETDHFSYKVLVFDEAHCVDSASISIKIFRTPPTVFVPSAFTPNGDGLNDWAAPIAVGIAHISYFRIFNRWGQLVFSTTENGRGWDGRINGTEQASATYVWIVGAVDYKGQPFVDRGTITLIR